MRIGIACALVVLAAGTAFAHPGTVSGDGCHFCRTRCEQFGLAAGQRHCHPERLSEAGGGGADESADKAGGGAQGRTGGNDAGTSAGNAIGKADVRATGRAAGSAATSATRQEGPSESAVIIGVTDGDTFQVKTASGKDKVRVLGIDCPESAHNSKCERDGRRGLGDCDAQVPKGLAAKRRAYDLLDGKTVTLEGPFSRDVFGRRLVYIRLPDGQDYGLLMIREGRCADYGWKYPHPRSAAYRQVP